MQENRTALASEKESGGRWTRPPGYYPVYGRAAGTLPVTKVGFEVRRSAGTMMAQTVGVAKLRSRDCATVSTNALLSNVCANRRHDSLPYTLRQLNPAASFQTQ